MTKIDGDRKSKAMRYFARGVSTAITGFIMLFVIGEGIASARQGKGLVWDYEHVKMTIYCLFIVVGTGLGWWRDKLGGMILTFIGILFAVMVFIEMESHDYWIIGIFGFPFFLSGLFFLLSWRRTRRLQTL